MERGFDPIRYQWSQACLPIAFNEIWQLKMEAISYREMTGKDRIRDLDYGVDVELRRAQRPPIIMAARFREPGAIKYSDITIRHRSLQTPGKFLETVKAVARYMTYAWADSSYHDFPKVWPSRFLDWVVIRLQELLDRFHDGYLKPKEEFKNVDKSSTGLPFDLHELDRQKLILYRKDSISKNPQPIPIETWMAHHRKRGVVLRGPDGRVIDWLWCLSTWAKLGRPVVYAAPCDPFYNLSLYMYPEKISPRQLQGIVAWLKEHSGERQ